jgi:hypothetical protein
MYFGTALDYHAARKMGAKCHTLTITYLVRTALIQGREDERT